MKYNWQKADWPNFTYDLTDSLNLILLISEKIGLLNGKTSHLNENEKEEIILNQMIEEAVKSSEIEGEIISRIEVKSSIQKKLGLKPDLIRNRDKRAEGIAELIFDARKNFKKSLTAKQLCEWHLMLLADSRNPNLRVGDWRIDDEPMQIVSGYHGKYKVHFEAPPAKRLPQEMKRFIDWFNKTAPGAKNQIQHASIRSAIAHLYFESIHPFEDGNGRIGRVIAEKALSQGLGYPLTISLSQAIERKKNEYYEALNKGSKSNEITPWINYFLNLILEAYQIAENEVSFILKKSKFFKRYELMLNTRQLKVVQRMLKEGSKGFKGGMSAKKYMIIADTSKATATRDLHDLVEMGAFQQSGSGPSVRYEINFK